MSKPERVVQTPGEPTPDDKAQRDAAIAAADSAAMSEKLTSNKPEGLRAVDVDPTKIRRAVLTLDGWVCPVEAPQYNAHR